MLPGGTVRGEGMPLIAMRKERVSPQRNLNEKSGVGDDVNQTIHFGPRTGSQSYPIHGHGVVLALRRAEQLQSCGTTASSFISLMKRVKNLRQLHRRCVASCG